MKRNVQAPEFHSDSDFTGVTSLSMLLESNNGYCGGGGGGDDTMIIRWFVKPARANVGSE